MTHPCLGRLVLEGEVLLFGEEFGHQLVAVEDAQEALNVDLVSFLRRDAGNRHVNNVL